jgi:heat shock protein HslJ
MTPSIAGTKWFVPTQGDAADRPRLEFMADGRLGGYSGCNAVSGTWRMEDGALRLGPLIMTKRACPGERDEMERRFLQAVNAQARFSIEGGRLVAQGASGARLDLTRDAGT